MTHLSRFAPAVLLALGLNAPAAQAQSALPPMISVTGEATISTAPDLAQIDGGVTTDGKTARDASSANNAAMGKVLLALKSAGLAEADYQTSRLSLQPQYASNVSHSSPNVITGYRASNRVSVKVRDVTKVANIIDTLVAAGANDIGGINFMVSNASKLLDEARPKAIADARRKAELYASAAGVALDTPISISEGGVSPPMPMARKLSADFASAPVATGEETLHLTVNVSWSIKPAAQ